MKKRILLISILGAALAAVFLIYCRNKLPQSAKTISNPSALSTKTVPPTTNQQPTAKNPLLDPATGLDFPISDFADRIKLNFFGTYFSAATTPRNQYPDSVCPNNTLYTGYHVAVDLETTPAEQNTDVPVYAISGGTIRFAGSASGYGGLVILGFAYNSQNYTAVYGHIDVRTLKVNVGEQVSQGEVLANLAPACSIYSGNNRKHLHFGIHKGSAIDESGYVATKSELNNWVDPRTFFGV